MITLITGAPGAGKSAALVKLLQELSKGRAIFGDGIPDLKVPHQPLKDPHQWMTEVPDGAAVFIDEVQRIWRPAGAGSRVPDDIAALETHRHRGLDFFIVTQHPKLVHSNVRNLVGRHVHLRDIGVLGRWWYEWPETCPDPLTGWKTAPVKKRYKLPKAHLKLYRSATEHIKPIRSVPPVVYVLGVALVGVGVAGWFTYKSISSRISPELAAAGPAPAASAAAVHSGALLSQEKAAAAWPAYHSVPVDTREPLEDLAIVIEGQLAHGGAQSIWFGLYSQGQRVTTMRLPELLSAGYRVEFLAPCIGTVYWKKLARPISCAPAPVPVRAEGPAQAASAAG